MIRITLAIIIVMIGISNVYANDALDFLKETKGVYRDEMFVYSVSYPVAMVENDKLIVKAVTNVSQNNGYLQNSALISCPLSNLKTAKLIVLSDQGIGKNICVKIKLKEPYKFSNAITFVIKASEDASKNQTRNSSYEIDYVDFYFDSLERANGWVKKMKDDFGIGI